jgi:hypothetical protein
MELLWRFLLGGTLVSLFALIGDVVRPKRVAGIFAGAPPLALTLAGIVWVIVATSLAWLNRRL